MNMDRFDDLMSAISFAEAGEHEKAKELLKGRDIVLLAVSERVVDPHALKYALSLSKRIEAGIDLLYLAKPDAKNPMLETFMSDARRMNIACTLVRKEGCMKKAILDYTGKKKEILFVIVGSTQELDIECKAGEKSLSEAWKKLKCPLVVVSKSGMPELA
jgi:hypothetical protein